ncbi:MAG: hypothetical protein ACREFC_04285 [Stellaceae bacterium]
MTKKMKKAPFFAAFDRSALTIVVLSGALALAGCGYSEHMWSSISGDRENVSVDPSATGPVSSSPLPRNSDGSQLALAVPGGSDTGTFVGQKVRGIRGDMQRLSENINQHNAELLRMRGMLAADASTYFTLTGTINSRLQVGTTPGNPELVAQFGQAQNQLDRMSGDIATLNALSSGVGSDLALAAYAIEEIRAALALQGAVDEYHRQLNALQAQANSDVVVIQQLQQAVTDDLTRQNSYISNERRNLATLSLAIKNGQLYGNNFSARQPTALAGAGTHSAYASATPVSVRDRRPLVTIRFDKADVPYEQALYTAVSRALERRPSAVFDLVAVSPSLGSSAQVSINADQAKRNAEGVMRALSKMGLPADRVALSSMTSGNVRDSEVQIYVR